MPRASRPLGALRAAPPSISRRAPLRRRGRGSAASAVATPRVAPGPPTPVHKLARRTEMPFAPSRRSGPRRVASRQVAPRLLPKASMLPGGIFGPQVGRGRVGDGPKVFPGRDAASAVLGGAPLAIRFFSLLITPPVRGGWVLKSVGYTERCLIDL